MTRKFRFSPRMQLLCLAASSAVAASCIGIYAFLSDTTEPLEAHFQMYKDNNMKVSIRTSVYEDNAVITPGATAVFDPYISNDGNQDAYIFMKVTVPHESFHLEINDRKWELLSREDDTAVYYFGSNGELTVLPRSADLQNKKANTSVTPPLCKNILLDEETPILDDIYHVSAVGYAIQTKGFEQNTPQQVWSNFQ